MKNFPLTKSFATDEKFSNGKKIFPDGKSACKSVISTDHNFPNGGSLQSIHSSICHKF